MENKERYNQLNNYLKKIFGERTLKICIDGGFTCPNRDGTCGYNGCIFCSQRGSGDHINNIKDISKQIENYFKSYKSERANKFIVYFQNFTNTYDSLENLKAKYDAALIDDRIVGLSIATRPDCINEDIANLLQSYTKKYHVFVELGLQTSNNKIGNIINRGYTSYDFTNAIKILNKYNIDIIAHVMVGLPTETFEDIQDTVNFININNIHGIKIHSTYIVKDTVLADMYKAGKYSPISYEYYMKSLVYIITHLRPNIVIHRITGDAPKELLIAPEWNLHKKKVLNGLTKILNEKNLWQGINYESTNKK